jgi:hypothetical protein
MHASSGSYQLKNNNLTIGVNMYYMSLKDGKYYALNTSDLYSVHSLIYTS